MNDDLNHVLAAMARLAAAGRPQEAQALAKEAARIMREAQQKGGGDDAK